MGKGSSAGGAERHAALGRHPHLGLPRRPGQVRVDCHLHTMWSGDSTTTPDELAAAVAAAGIDVVCITDHSTLKGARLLVDALDCRVVVGQEQRTPEGEIIGLFLSEPIPPGSRSAEEAARHVRRQGGLVYIPHPFDPLRHHLVRPALERLAGEGLIDVIEARNAKTSLESLNIEALAACRRLDVRAGAGSDAHVPEAVGAAYVETDDFDGPEEFLESLRAAVVVGHHYDAARPWRARIVPSLREGRAGELLG